MKTFKINKVELPYAREFFNEAWSNERSLEVSLGRYFVNRFPENTLEVGAVLPYYDEVVNHNIIDLADEHPKSKKVNALDQDYTGLNVLSISTIEHMSTKEYGNGSDDDSIKFLTKVLTQASNYVITWGVGYNPYLDEYLKTHPEVPRLIMKRLNWKNEYIKHWNNNDFNMPFGHSDKPIPEGYFNNANGVCIVTNLKETTMSNARETELWNHYKTVRNDRDAVFLRMMALFNQQPVKILEIGAARSLNLDAKGGDGWSSVFWAEYIAQFGWLSYNY